MNFSSILLPHDGSPLSGAIIAALQPIIEPETTVTLLHVRTGEERDEDSLPQAASKLQELGARVVRKDVDSPDAAGVILDTAEALRPDLIAMTTHGRSGLERWVRGSVAERVVRASQAPLLMVNPFASDSARISSILVPLDGSDNSAQSMRVAIPMARAYGARLTLLFVDWDDPTDSPDARVRRRAQRAEDIADWLARPRADAGAAGVEVELQIAHGDVAEEILRLTDPAKHDLQRTRALRSRGALLAAGRAPEALAQDDEGLRR